MCIAASPIHVLHVDDEPDFADMVATFLERHDSRFSVVTACDPRKGFEKVDVEELDCIVSDYDMPDTDGLDFLKEVRADHPNLPFILYTGKGSEEVASRAISAGVTDYIRKQSETSHYEVLTNRIRNAVEQRRAHEFAEETERRLEEIASNSKDILWLFSADWTELLFMNSAYEEVMGRPVADLHEEPRLFLEDIHPDDRSVARSAMADLTSGEPIDVELRVNPTEGYERWLWVKGRPILEDEETVRVVGFARDVTDRKRRERELQRIRDRMEFALEATDAIVWDWNVDADEATFHPSEETLYGTTVETFDDFVEIVHPEDRPAVREALEEAIATGTMKSEEIRLVVDDEVQWIETKGWPVTDDGTTRMIGVARDVTERHRRERKLKQQNERL